MRSTSETGTFLVPGYLPVQNRQTIMNSPRIQRVKIVDSHTGGEPTRTVIAGGPDLGRVGVAEQTRVFRARHDDFRRGVVCEPRGSDVMVGALLVPPVLPDCAAGVIFFNNVGYLGMCGHGIMGVIATLAYLGRIEPGEHRIETPVGVVTARLHDDGSVSVQNVPAYRHAKDVCVAVEGIGTVRGDVAWGGNWFFLMGEHGQELSLANVETLTEWTWRVRQALAQNGVMGRDGYEIDHIELFAPSPTPGMDSRNFRPLPRQSLRPLALRHGNQRETRLPVRGRQTPVGRNVAAGEHRRQRV